MNTFFLSSFNSPIGLVHFVHHDNVLYALDFEEFDARLLKSLNRYLANDFELSVSEDSAIHALLESYFLGDINALDRIKTHALGTNFQQQVWQALRTIPVGKTASYQQIAHQINNKDGQRAVGMANGKNPIPLVIPCHRVINSNGKLGGYSGALWRKEWLLKHEGANIPLPLGEG
ncbi:MAG: methylated-DNA--[protein]-cysteine S-methyltransferase [Moraxellaceae bacterium]|nr:methylated-DNA--[protein]-cysteine S-methyltransferase [Moraxellaceae bacterium]